MTSAVRATVPPFLRFDARTGWPLGLPGTRPGVHARDGALVLGVPGREPIAVDEPFGTFGGRTLPRGLAVSPEGWVLLAHPDLREVLAVRTGAPQDGTPAAFTPLWPARPLASPHPHDVTPPAHPPADPYVLVRPTDVALAPWGDLVVADPGAGRLLVLAFPTGRLRRVVTVPGGAPTAVAFDERGRAHVADPSRGTVTRYDRQWRVDPDYPHPSVVLEAPQQVALVRTADDAPCCGCGRGGCGGPCGRLRGAHVLVLDGARVVGLDERGRAVALDQVPELTPGALRRRADGALEHLDPTRPALAPLRLPALALTRDGRDVGTGRPLLALPRRVELPRSGRFTTTALDGGRPGFPWDRVVLRGDVPDRGRLLVRTLTSDSPLEADRVDALPDASWSAPLVVGADDPPEVLVQSGGGRWLWLRVELFGDGTVTPRLTGIDVHGPRRSSVRHLPASYHSDPESVRFLDRFLSCFDTVFAEITAEHREVAALFDPWAVPDGGALSWLGGWFDLEFLAEWSPQVRRRMVEEAVASSRERGTVAGLRRIVQRHTGLTDPLPQVVEHFRLPEGEAVPIGGAPLDAPRAAHTCTVVLPEAVVPDDAASQRLVRLLADHAPGHVRVLLRLVPARIAVGHQSTVGVDMLLGRSAPGALGEGRLGEDLTFRPPRPSGLVPDLPSTSPRSTPC